MAKKFNQNDNKNPIKNFKINVALNNLMLANNKNLSSVNLNLDCQNSICLNGYLRAVISKNKKNIKNINLNISKKPWETKPDFLEFIDEDTGYRCFIERRPELKHLCGYVELPKEHKLYGSFSEENFYNIEVHGGVTYTGRREFKQQNYTADYVVGF